MQSTTKDLESKIRHMLNRGKEPIEIVKKLSHGTRKEDLVEVIARLMRDVIQPTIGGSLLVNDNDGKDVPMRVETVMDVNAFPDPEDRRQSLKIQSPIPALKSESNRLSDDEAVIRIAPYEGRIEVQMSWSSESNHRSMTNIIYKDKISTGSNEDGEQYVLERPEEESPHVVDF